MENFQILAETGGHEIGKVSLSREVTTRDRWRFEIAPKLKVIASFVPALSLHIQHFSTMIDVQDAT